MESNLLLIFGAVAAGFLIGRFIRPKKPAYQLQNTGEALVRIVISEHLPRGSWHLLNNITLPLASGSTTQIDHILISRFGIFVIETKHYSGWIFGETGSREWTQVVYSQKNKFQNPLVQNNHHIKVVQDNLDFLDSWQVQGMVVFTGKAEFKTIKPSGVYSLQTMIDNLRSRDVEVLSENRMQFCIGRLEHLRLALTQETDVQHQKNLQSRRR
jgi:hypothetical protein